MVRHLSFCLSISLVLLAASGAAEARSWKNPIAYLLGRCVPEPQESFDKATQKLCLSLAKRPELMNIEYLQYFLGRPDNERSQRDLAERAYFWYDLDRQVKQELYQKEDSSCKIVQATMVLHLRNSELTFAKIRPLLGLGEVQSKPFFDYNGHLCEVFALTPNTFICFSSPQNTFRIKTIRIYYAGPGLPQPDNIAVLQRPLTENSSEANTHYLLGKSFLRKNQVNEAIAEYEEAVAASSNPQERDFYGKVLEQLTRRGSNMTAYPYQPLEIGKNGQYLRVSNHR